MQSLNLGGRQGIKATATNKESSVVKNLKLTPRVAGSIALTLLITSTVGFFITQKRINSQAELAFVDKLRKTDGMADQVRTYFSANVDTYLVNHQFKDLKQVPVVV